MRRILKQLLLLHTGEAPPPAPEGVWTNLVAAYNMEAASGNESDVLNSFDLIAVGTPGSTTGKIGNGRTFTVGSDHFTVAQTGDLAFTDTFSISFFINPSKTEATHHLIEGTDWEILIDGDILTVNLSQTTVGTAFVEPSNWYHVVVTYDNPNVLLYINGVLDGNTSLQSSNPEQVSMVIGANAAGAQGFEGVMDLLYFWNRELTAGDVTELNNGGAGLEYI